MGMTRRAPRLALAAAAMIGFAAPAAAGSMDLDAPAPSLAIATNSGFSDAAVPMMTSAALAKPTKPSFAFAAPAALRTAHAERPDVFGSTALRLSRTPFDARFARVAGSRMLGRSAAFANSLRHVDAMRAIEAVNAHVNARVRFVDDAPRADRWATASATLDSGKGDCEDYAIAKMQMLRAAGFAADDLYFVVLKDLVRRADHAVLVVRYEGRFLVLDNGTDRIIDSDAVRDYRPIFTYSSAGSWMHGYAAPRQSARPHVRVATASF